MARRAVLRPAARRDLAELYAYIRDERGDPEIAVGYVRRIRAFCESLATFPERGMRRDGIRPGLRIVGFERRIVVAFSVTPETVVVVESSMVAGITRRSSEPMRPDRRRQLRQHRS